MLRPGEDVLGVLAALEADRVLVGGREVVVAAVAVVDERARHRARRVRVVVEERDRDVVRVELRARPVRARVAAGPAGGELRARVGVEHVGVPQREVAALAVVAAGLLAEPVDRVLRAGSGAAP